MTSIAASDADVSELYEELRPLLFSIAYRMVGSVGEAEDIVQEAFVRFERGAGTSGHVESPKGYLTTVVTRLAIDHLRSARRRRESYVGTWLPEPLVDERAPDVAAEAEMSDSLSMALLTLLETLSPVERAVFLLREVFGYGYDEIAEIVQRSEPNCRQIFARARRRIDAGKPRFEASREEREQLVHAFINATEEGEMDDLVGVLAADVVFYGDGGGKATAVLRPIYGRERVGRLLGAFAKQAKGLAVSFNPIDVNGQPGLITRDADGRVISVLAFEVADGLIEAIHSVVNPDKLGHLGPVSDLARRDR
jgi:RNA polymerase sigma-70 factor, ECF subfamily